METFEYKNGVLFAEEVSVPSIVEEFGSPVFIYSKKAFLGRFQSLKDAFAPCNPSIAFSVKTNANMALLKIIGEKNSFFDVVSGGEMRRVLSLGFPGSRIVYAGVGKTDNEIRMGLENRIFCFNVESEEELANINKLAIEMDVIASVALRVNPDVDPKTHTYITTGKKESKFGVDFDRAARILNDIKSMDNVNALGIHCHIGSQITTVEPYVEALEKVATFIKEQRANGHTLEVLNIGGGFGIKYEDEEARTAQDFADVIVPIVKDLDCKLVMEPGRFIAGNSGILATTVQYIKESGEKRFVIVDSGMHTVIRPCLYDAYHGVWPVETNIEYNNIDKDVVSCDVVGPICESSDFFAKDRMMPVMKRNDILAVFSTGAYGLVMASSYNQQPRPAEVVVDGDKAYLTRKAETYADLEKFDIIPSELV